MVFFRRCWMVAGMAGLMAALAVAAGCSREKYYRQADAEAKSLIFEKSNDPRWAMPPDYTVTLDPRSRYYDPCDTIRPPMPADDPASHVSMHCVDGMKGYKKWHANGDRAELANPAWLEQLGTYAAVTPEGRVKLTLESAMDVARINSPDYQSQLETLYLSALDVSTERFRFDVQFFGSYDSTLTTQGRLHAGGSRTAIQNDLDLQARRKFATAGELLVGFANSMVWQFAGPDTYATTSLLNFNLVQPLLRGAGRDVALEQLTITERALLANLRAMQRYRQGFFTRVAIGESGVSGPQRRGGFFGGTGLTGFTGTGSGGFGELGNLTGFGRGGFGAGGGGGTGGGAGFAGGGAGTTSGFIGLLQQLQQIRNSEENLSAQLRTLGLLEAHYEAGTIDLYQVDLFRQNIETERANLLQSRNNLEDAIESYNTGTLGMPPDLPLDLDDAFVRQFQFIDPAVIRIQNRISDYRTEFGRQPPEPELEALRGAIARLEGLRAEVGAHFAPVAADLQGLAAAVSDREATMTESERGQFAKDLRRVSESFADLKRRIDAAESSLAQLAAGLAPANRRATADRLVQSATDIASIADELSLVQARARLEQVVVDHERLDPQAALNVARANRLDWMNNRAALVDTWRLIQFNADALQSNLNVVLSGDMSTTGDNPLKFRSPTGTLRAGVQFDGPFTRLLERNNFRQVLINYQQDRRRLIQYEDSVQQTLRQLLRQLEQLRVNLEIQRRAVIIAIRRVDQTREMLNQPPPPPQPGQAAEKLDPTAALNLLTALNDLRSAQNNVMSVWLVYQTTRMRLARELGTMELDDRGMWVRRPLDDLDRAQADDVPLPPAVPDQWIDELS